MFLHADSSLPDEWEGAVRKSIASSKAAWGAFDTIEVEGVPSFQAWILKNGVKLRTRCLHSPYGDQGIFVRRKEFEEVHGFPDDWPLLEDVELVRKLKKTAGSPVYISQPIATSGRRWRNIGFVRTTMINQCVLLGHRLGVDIHKLADFYDRARGVDQ